MTNLKAYDAPFVQMGGVPLTVRDVLKSMVDVDATDLYVKVGEPIIFKIAGKVKRYDTDRLTDRHVQQVMACFFTKADLERFQQRREADMVHIEGEVRYRIHLATGNHGAYGVFRRIAQDIIPVDKLGLPAKAVPNLKSVTKGLILIAGATGQGKTMTAVSLLEHIARTRGATLLTLEDPIEYVFPECEGLFLQREVGMHVDSFADGVRSALRENLDVIYVGEMREPDTIEQTLRAAEMGHLVLTTIHAEDTVSALARIVGSFTAGHQARIRYTLSSGLAAVITQKLLPGRDGGSALAAEVTLPTTAIRSVLRAGDFGKIGIYLGQPGSGVGFLEHLQEVHGARRISTQTRDEEINAYKRRSVTPEI